MAIVERGSGPALVLIPGIQGRWQYHVPAIDALARYFRVITFSLSGEAGAGHRFDPAQGLDNYTDQVDAALAAVRVEAAVVCGVSFGAVAAVHYAAVRRARCRALVLVSPPRPGLQLRRKHEIYVKMPRLFGPLFIASTPWRLRTEIQRALPVRRDRLRLGVRVMRTFLGAPPSLTMMAARAQLLVADNVSADCARITAPTLIVTGERDLDHVVPVAGSSEYAALIRGARAVVIPDTGHIGSNTRPDVFAGFVRAFVNDHDHAAA